MDAESRLVSDAYLTARAFEDLYNENSGKIFGYAARRVGPDLAEEVTAQVFAEAWAQRDRFDPKRGAPIVWLLGMATNMLRRFRRSEMAQLNAYAQLKSRVTTSFVDDHLAALDRIVADERWSKVAGALVHLADLDREILTLAGWTDLSYAEIANVLGIEIGTVRSRMSRARGRLMEHLGVGSSAGEDWL